MRQVLLVFVFLVLCSPAYQSYSQVEFSKRYSINGSESLSQILPAFDSGRYISFTSDATGKEESYITKLDSLWNPEWTKVYNPTGRGDFIKKIILTEDSNLLFIGTVHVEKNTDWKLWIAKLDLQGNYIWSKFYGFASQSPVSIVKSFSGGYILSARIVDTTDTDTTIVEQNVNLLIMKLDENGEKKWHKILGTYNHDFAYSMLTLSDSNYIVSGYSRSLGTSVKNAAFLMKFNDNGQIIVNRGVRGNPNTSDLEVQYKQLVILNDSTLLYNLGMYDSSFGNVWLFLNLNGDSIRSIQRHLTSHSVQLINDNEIYTSASNSVIRIDENGKELYKREYFFDCLNWNIGPSQDPTTGQYLVVTKNFPSFQGFGFFSVDSLFYGGCSSTDAPIYDTVEYREFDFIIEDGVFREYNFPFDDTLISIPPPQTAQLNVYELCVTGIENTENVDDSDFYVFPNPNSGSFSINLKDIVFGSWDFQLLDLQGKLLFFDELRGADFSRSNHYLYENDSLKQGTYIVRITKGNKSFQAKVFITP